MTGIERLRELVGGISLVTAVCHVTRTSYDREHMDEAEVRLRDFLDDIADQIEREQDEEAKSSLADYLRVRSVEREMERHILDHEGMEDSPVARWARELREALGGRDDEEVTNVATIRKDAYDAYEWVREHGGLDHVMAEWSSRVPYDRHEKTRQRLLGHIAECETALGRRRESIEELGHRVNDLTTENAELRKRAVPEGMEWLLEIWPMWSNGEYCRFGDWWKSDKYGVHEPEKFRKLSIYTPEQLDEWGQGDGESYGYEWNFIRPSDPKHRPDKVEPPAPAVLAADDEPLEVGQTVYEVGENYPPFVVGRLPEPGAYRSVRVVYPSGAFTFLDPERLTHTKPEPPDSWERIEEDADALVDAEINGEGSYNAANAYCNRRGLGEGTSFVLMAQDLVRRCRALAERERGE